jgi:hypothetical protein
MLLAERGRSRNPPPNLTSAFNIAAFNLGSAGGAYLEGLVLDSKLGLNAVVPSQNLNPDVLMMKPDDWYCCYASDLLRTLKIPRMLAQ